MKIISLLLFVLLITNTLIAQELKENVLPKNSIFFELYGSAFLYSINYERIFYLKSENIYVGRAGAFIFPLVEEGNGPWYSIPLTINKLIGTSNHKLEIGIGELITIAKTNDGTKTNLNSVTNVILGYRYQPKNSGLLFRLSYTPWISNDDFPDFEGSHRGGVSLGYSF